MIKRNRPTEITDAPEHRNTQRFEIRAEADTITLEGYASTFEPYEMYGGPAAGGWIEQLATTAFDKTLREKPDLHLLINHEGMPLARTKSGTLTLSTDKHGLKVVAPLDRSDPDVQRLEPKMKRRDMDEMSFAFRVKSQTWSAAAGFEDDPMSYRVINEVSLHKGDVSVVNFGANDTTHAELKSIDQALELLAMCSPEDLVEARSSGGDEVFRRAQAVLEMLTRGRGHGGAGGMATPLPRGVIVGAGGGPTQGGAGAGGGGSFGLTTFTVQRGESAPVEPEAAQTETEPAPATGEQDTAADDAEARVDTTTGGRKPMSVAEAFRRMGYGADDGTMLSTADAVAQSAPATTE